MPSNADTVAARLIEARKNRTRVDADFIAAHPLTVEEALAVQAAVQSGVGDIAGWKVAPQPEGKISMGPVFAVNVKPSPAAYPADTFQHRGIECEMAYRLGRDLLDPPYDVDAVLDAIDAVMPAIEIVDTRLHDPKAAPYPWPLADNQSSGGLVFGEPVADWRSVDSKKESVVLKFDGKVIAERDRHPAEDDVLAARVALLVNQAGKHCGGVRAGHIVLTGSMTGNIPVDTGTTVTADYGSLGSLKVEV